MESDTEEGGRERGRKRGEGGQKEEGGERGGRIQGEEGREGRGKRRGRKTYKINHFFIA